MLFKIGPFVVFLGVHEFTSVLSLQGDMGWKLCLINQKLKQKCLGSEVICLQCKRVEEPKVFSWHKAHNCAWCHSMIAMKPTVWDVEL